jgi:hypothetical protein
MKDCPDEFSDAMLVEGRTGRRVALLVDGDNIAQDLASSILDHAKRLGQLVVRRVYGNAAHLPKWDGSAGFRMVHSGSGKYAADMLLVIEAMGLARGAGIDTFVIVSSDRDFTHLAHHLRERHFRVVGMGEDKTSGAFRNACTDFQPLARSIAPVAADVPKATPPGAPTLDTHIRDLIRCHKAGSAAMPISLLGGKIHQTLRVKVKTTMHASWRAYFASKPQLYALDPKGPNAQVRYLPAGFHAMAAV